MLKKIEEELKIYNLTVVDIKEELIEEDNIKIFKIEVKEDIEDYSLSIQIEKEIIKKLNLENTILEIL